MTMENVAELLGQRIVEAARLAVLLHLRESMESTDDLGRGEFDPRAASLAWSAGLPGARNEREAA
jgi:hypothetical protein